MTDYYAPDHVRKLRNQKKQLEREKRDLLDRHINDQEAARLRNEIRAMGAEPCA